MTHDLKFDVPALKLALTLERGLHRRDRQREDAGRARRPAARGRDRRRRPRPAPRPDRDPDRRPHARGGRGHDRRPADRGERRRPREADRDDRARRPSSRSRPQSYGSTTSPTEIVPELRMSALRPPRWSRSSMIPGRVSDCRCRHGSQSSTPRHSTSPTSKPLADEVVQPHAAHDDLAPRLRAGQADVLEHLGLDQRERAARPLAVRAVCRSPSSPQPATARHRLDRRERIRRRRS